MSIYIMNIYIMNKVKYKKIERDFYEKFWRNLKGRFSFDKTHFSSEVPDLEIFDFIKTLKKNKVKGKILDIGCGNSRNIIPFNSQSFKLFGIEISPEAIKLSKMNSSLNNIKIELKEGSFLEKNYKNNEFQVCVDSGLFHHLRKYQWSEYLNVLNGVLCSGGYFYLKVFSIESGRLHKFTPPSGRRWLKKNNHVSRLFDKSEIENIFGNTFEILKIIKTRKGKTPLKFLVFFMKKK